MRTTPNLGLKKPDQTDFYNIEDSNHNADAIDYQFSGTDGHKHTGATGDAPQIDSSGIVDNAVTDAKIGNRTISDTAAPTGNTATPTTLLGWLAYMIKSMTGEINWWTVPGMTIKAIKSILDAATNMATANTLAKRDANGRFKASAPVANDDVARKAETDAAYARADAAFQSASSGKTAIAAAVTGMGQAANGSETFDQLAVKIRDISKDATTVPASVIAGETFYQGGVKRVGTMPNHSAKQGLNGFRSSSSEVVSVKLHPENGNYGSLQVSMPKHGYVDTFTHHSIDVVGLIPDHIKAGVWVGNHGDANKSMIGTFTSDANAVPEAILTGYNGYVNGVKVNGSMTDSAGFHVPASQVWYDTASGNVFFKSSAYNTRINSDSWLYADTGLGADLPKHIKKGTNLFGILGEFEGGKPLAEGTATSSSVSLPAPRGYTGTFNYYYIQVTGLSFQPRLVIAYIADNTGAMSLFFADGFLNDGQIFSQMLATNGYDATAYHFKAVGNYAQPTNGFIIPVGPSSRNFKWVAYA
jgi:hypothetical protein